MKLLVVNLQDPSQTRYRNPTSHPTNGYEWEKCLKLMRDKLE
jgi:hypothetical protein